MSWYIKRPIAHRGFHKGREVPENSLLAFSEAIKRDHPIELDVFISLDGHVIVHHDENLKRMTGKDILIEDAYLSDIKRCTLFETDELIPTLNEVLDLVNGSVPIVIELKSFHFNGKLEQAVFDLVKDYKGEFSIQSFNPLSLEWFKKKDPNIIRGLLSYSFFDIEMAKYKKFALRNFLFLKKVSPHYIGFAFDELDSLSISLIRRITKLPILAWTVESKEDWERIEPCCHNIIFENFDI